MKTLCILLVLLSISFLPTSRSACSSFTLGTETFDLCQIPTAVPVFALDTIIDGSISYSIGEANVPSCASSSTMIWGKLQDGLGDCYDIATADPVITLLDSTNAKSGGLRLKYPVSTASSGEKFELEILLHCAPKQFTLTDKSFTLTKMFGQASTGVTTYTISGSSDYACATYTGCPPQMLYNWNYQLCDLNTTSVFNLVDPMGGHLTFNLGGTPKILGCSWPHEADYIYGNYNANSGECFSASSTVGPTITPLSTWDKNAGLLFEYHYPYSTMRNLIVQIKLKLLCNPTQTNVNLIAPTVDVTYVEWYLTFDLVAESALACAL